VHSAPGCANQAPSWIRLAFAYSHPRKETVWRPTLLLDDLGGQSGTTHLFRMILFESGVKSEGYSLCAGCAAQSLWSSKNSARFMKDGQSPTLLRGGPSTLIHFIWVHWRGNCRFWRNLPRPTRRGNDFAHLTKDAQSPTLFRNQAPVNDNALFSVCSIHTDASLQVFTVMQTLGHSAWPEYLRLSLGLWSLLLAPLRSDSPSPTRSENCQRWTVRGSIVPLFTPLRCFGGLGCCERGNSGYEESSSCHPLRFRNFRR
jgi:hypothetical protein